MVLEHAIATVHWKLMVGEIIHGQIGEDIRCPSLLEKQERAYVKSMYYNSGESVVDFKKAFISPRLNVVGFWVSIYLTVKTENRYVFAGILYLNR